MGGCGNTSDTTVEGYPNLRSPEEAAAAEEQVQQLSAPIFAKIENRQPLTDQDKLDFREAARITEGQALVDRQAFGPYWRLGQIYLAVGEYDLAIDRLKTFIRQLPKTEVQLAPRLADARYLIAQAHAGKEDFKKAVEELNAAIAEYPDSPEFLFLRAQCYVRLKDTDRAKRDLFRLLQKNPEAVEANILLIELNKGAKKGR